MDKEEIKIIVAGINPLWDYPASLKESDEGRMKKWRIKEENDKDKRAIIRKYMQNTEYKTTNYNKIRKNNQKPK